MTQTQLDSSQYKPAGAATQVQFNGSGAMSASSNFTFDGTVLTVSQMKVTSIAAGFLPPVVTTAQKNAIVSPALGSIVYDSTLNFLQEWNGTAWVNVGPVPTPAGSNGDVQFNNAGAFGADTGNFDYNLGTQILTVNNISDSGSGLTLVNSTDPMSYIQIIPTTSVSIQSSGFIDLRSQTTVESTLIVANGQLLLENANATAAVPILFYDNSGIFGDGFAVTLSAPATLSSSYSLNLPTAQGAAGTFLQNDGAGNLTFAPAVTSAAGSNGDVQFNNAGAFGADTGNFDYNLGTQILTVNNISDSGSGLTLVNSTDPMSYIQIIPTTSVSIQSSGFIDLRSQTTVESTLIVANGQLLLENANATAAVPILFYDNSGIFGDGFAVTLSAPATLSSSYSLNLPTAQGAAGTFLQNDGAGNLTFAPAVTSAAGSNGDVQFNNAGAFGADTGNLTWTGTVLDITGTLGTTAISTSGDIAGGNLNGITLSLSSAQTTLTGIAGTAICSQPEQGSSYKKVIIYLNGYTDTGTQTYTYPTAFINTPYVYGLAAGVSGASVSITSVNFTVTTQTGFVFLEGY